MGSALVYDAKSSQRLRADSRVLKQDHFLLAGPPSNPAQLNQTDDILVMFNKIVSTGNADVAVGSIASPSIITKRYSSEPT